MIVFLISGLWHGSNWKFIIWGGIYGIILVIERICGVRPEKFPAIPGRILTFIVVTLLWTLFRAESLETAIMIIEEFFTFDFKPLTDEMMAACHIPEIDFAISKLGVSDKIYRVIPYIVLGSSLLISQVSINSKDFSDRKLYMKRAWMVILLLIALVSTMSFSTSTSFIYWNF
jgi:hypothetical protein